MSLPDPWTAALCTLQAAAFLSRGGPWKLTGATPVPLPLPDGVGAGRPSGGSETHFRSGIDSDLTTTTTHTHTHASFPLEEVFWKVPSMSRGSALNVAKPSPPGLTHLAGDSHTGLPGNWLKHLPNSPEEGRGPRGIFPSLSHMGAQIRISVEGSIPLQLLKRKDHQYRRACNAGSQTQLCVQSARDL